MYHAKSYESGIGMYRNYILDPFPNRYRNYLQDWHDTSMMDSGTNVAPPTKSHRRQSQQHPLPPTTAIYTDRQQLQQQLRQQQQQLLHDKIPSKHQSTNIIVTNNPLCLSYNNIPSNIYGYCSGKSSNQKIYQPLPMRSAPPPLCSNAIYGQLPTHATNVPYGNRCGSESDIFYMSRNGRGNFENFSADSIDRAALDQQYSSRYYEETALQSRMPNNASYHDNYFHPFYQNQYHHMHDEHDPIDYMQSARHMSDRHAADAEVAFKLRRTASNESFFGYPIEIVQSPPPLPVKQKKYKKKDAPDNKKRNLPSNKKLVRSSSHRSTSSTVPVAPAVVYAKDDQSLLRSRAKKSSEEELESSYGYLKPRQVRNYARSIYHKRSWVLNRLKMQFRIVN